MRGPADTAAAAHVFVEGLADELRITGADGHHLQRVRRLSTGERVTAADGSGAWRLYEIVAADAAALRLAAREPIEYSVAPSMGVALAVGLTKRGLEDVVTAVTELGVTAVTPVRSERTVVRWDAARSERAIARLQLAAREASMQARRVRVPVIEPVLAVGELAGRPGLVVADRVGVAPAELAVPSPPGWTVLVGPEGGLSAAELRSLEPFERVALGPNVLRAGTAPIAAVALLADRARVLPAE